MKRNNENKLEKINLNDPPKNRKPYVLAAAGLMACLLAGVGAYQSGSLAFLTDSQNVINEFTNGSIETDLTEPDWPGDQTETHPGDVIPKNPQITAKSDSNVPAFVYLQVKVPKGEVTKVNDDGTLADKNADGSAREVTHQLLTYGVGETGDTKDAFDQSHGLAANLNDTATGWTLIQTETTGRAATDDARITGYQVYTYAYNSMLACTLNLNPDMKGNGCIVDSTEPLFSKVRLINCIEGQLDQCKIQMPIKSFVIQAAHTGDDSKKDENTVPTETREVIRQANTAFKKYANQNEHNGNATTLPGDFVVK